MPATIIRVDVIAHKDAQGHTVQQPIVMYAYEVAAVRYSTDRVAHCVRRPAPDAATDVALRFHAGDTVTAYYDPDTPGSAFLINRAQLDHSRCIRCPAGGRGTAALLWPRVLGQARAG